MDRMLGISAASKKPGDTLGDTPARKTVDNLFIHELSDVYSAEKQITLQPTHFLPKLSPLILKKPKARSNELISWWRRQVLS